MSDVRDSDGPSDVIHKVHSILPQQGWGDGLHPLSPPTQLSPSSQHTVTQEPIWTPFHTRGNQVLESHTAWEHRAETVGPHGQLH